MVGETYNSWRSSHLAKCNSIVEQCRPNLDKPAPTKFMAENMIKVTCMRSWIDIESRFLSACHEYGVITVDSEDRIDVDNSWDAQESIIIGTGRGIVLDLHVPSLKAEAKRDRRYVREDLRTVLPSCLLAILEDGKIFKLGSDLGKDSIQDFERFSVKVTPCYCTQDLHEAAEQYEVFDAERNPSRAFGLGRSAFELFGADHKPLTDVKYKRNYKVERPRAWRWFANPMWLYRWAEPLSPFQELYKYLDAMVPLSLLARVVTHGLQSSALPEDLVCKPIKELFWQTLSPFQVVGQWVQNARTKRKSSSTIEVHAECVLVGSGVLFDGLDAGPSQPSGCHAEEGRSAEEGCPAEEGRVDEDEDELILYPSREDLALVDEDGCQYLPGDGPDEWEDEFEIGASKSAIDWARNSEEGPPACSRPREQGARNRKRRAIASTFSIKRRRQQACSWAMQPIFHRRCDFCGSSTHSKYSRSGEPQCPHFCAQLRLAVSGGEVPRLCLYPICRSKPKSHRVAACPTLMGRCETCGLRGHTVRDCPDGEETKLKMLREMFEQYADCNALLAKRNTNATWGFYPTCHRQLDYKAVLSMEPKDALKLFG